MDLEEQAIEDAKTKFNLVGILTSTSFQKCKCYIERLCKAFPTKFSKPTVRPMLNVDWTQYLTKIRRTIGGKSWYSQKTVAVFINKTYIGDDDDLLNFIQKEFFFSLATNFEKLSHTNLKDYLIKITETGRRLVYLTITINNRYIGSLLFLLYMDLVPITCNNFLKRCTTSKSNYLNKPIHRVVESGWIQGGGWNLRHKPMPCENYVVAHDRRGVLSMSNSEKHTNNSTQFIVSLVPAPWMNYKYVAFGQLIQGEEVLAAIEKVPTRYEYPTRKITIANCGEFYLDQPVSEKDRRTIDNYLLTSASPRVATLIERETTGQSLPLDIHEDVIHLGDVPSNELLKERYDKGLYSLENDLCSHKNSVQLPKYLLYLHGDYGEEQEFNTYIESDMEIQ